MNKFIATTVGASLLSLTVAAKEKPNIVLFLVDDMGAMDTSLPFLVDENGQPKKHPLNSFYKTPGMERLATQGVRFGRFYANSVCSPTRASLMTGQSSAHHNTTQWINPHSKNVGPADWNWLGLKKSSVTLPRILQQSGYTTIHSGKAHFGPKKHEGAEPTNLGFDINIGGCAIGHPGSYYGMKGYGKGASHAVPGLEQYHGTETFLTDALTIEANKAVSTAAKSNKPFYLYMSHYAVHGPFNSDPRFADNYKDSGKPKNAEAFATLIEGMDKSLIDIMDHLEKIGEAENTLIIFLGDNGSDAPLGGPTDVGSSAPLKGKKGSSYEGGMRVPFIAAWAKVNPESKFQKKFPIKQGIISDAFGSCEDIFPTVLKVTGAKAPADYAVDGADLTDFFATHKGAKEQEFLMHFPHNHRSSNFTTFVKGNWKINYYYPTVKKKRGKQKVLVHELFNLKADPYESQNLAKTNPEKFSEIFKEMTKALDKAEAQYNVDKEGKEICPKL